MSTNPLARNSDTSFRMTRWNEEVPEGVINSLLGRGLGYNDWKTELEQQGYGCWTKSVKFRIIQTEFAYFREEIEQLQLEENVGGSKSKSNSLESILKRLKGEVWIEGVPDEGEQRKLGRRLLGKDAKPRCLQLHVRKWKSQRSPAVPSHLLTNWNHKRSSSSPPALSKEIEPSNGLQSNFPVDRKLNESLEHPYMNDFQNFPDSGNYYGQEFTESSSGGLATSSSFWTPSLDLSRNSSRYEPSISDVAANLSLFGNDYAPMEWSQLETGESDIWKTDIPPDNGFPDHGNMGDSQPPLEGNFGQGGVRGTLSSQFTPLPDSLREAYHKTNDNNPNHDLSLGTDLYRSGSQRKPVNGLLGTPNNSRQSSRSYHAAMSDSLETISLGGSAAGKSKSADGLQGDGRRPKDTSSIRGRIITKLRHDLDIARDQLGRKDDEVQRERRAKEDAEAIVQELLEKIIQLEAEAQKTFENSAEMILSAPGQRQPHQQRLVYSPAPSSSRGPEARAGVLQAQQTEHRGGSFPRTLPIRMGSGGTGTSSQCNSPVSPNSRKNDLPPQSPTQGSFSRLIGKFSPKPPLHKKMREEKNDPFQNHARSGGDPQKKVSNDSVYFFEGGNGDW